MKSVRDQAVDWRETGHSVPSLEVFSEVELDIVFGERWVVETNFEQCYCLWMCEQKLNEAPCNLMPDAIWVVQVFL